MTSALNKYAFNNVSIKMSLDCLKVFFFNIYSNSCIVLMGIRAYRTCILDLWAWILKKHHRYFYNVDLEKSLYTDL